MMMARTDFWGLATNNIMPTTPRIMEYFNVNFAIYLVISLRRSQTG